MSDNDEPDDYLEAILDARTQQQIRQARDEEPIPPPERALRPYHFHGPDTSHRPLLVPIPLEPGLAMANCEVAMPCNPRQTADPIPDGVLSQLSLPPQPSSTLHGTGGMTALVNAWAAIGERLRTSELRHYEAIVRTARHNPPPAPTTLRWEQQVNRGSPFVLRVPLTVANDDDEVYQGDDEDDEDGGHDDEDDHEHGHEHEEEDGDHDEEGNEAGDALEIGEGDWHHIGRVVFIYHT